MELEKEIDQRHFHSVYHKLILNVLYTGKWLDYNHSQIFKQYGITSQQYNILRILRGASPKPATIQYLTDRMLDKSSNASRLVDKLEEKGWASRTICEHNRRAVDVAITDAGLALLGRMDGSLKEEVMLSGCLTEAEAESLNILLDKLRDSTFGPVSGN